MILSCMKAQKIYEGFCQMFCDCRLSCVCVCNFLQNMMAFKQMLSNYYNGITYRAIWAQGKTVISNKNVSGKSKKKMPRWGSCPTWDKE